MSTTQQHAENSGLSVSTEHLKQIAEEINVRFEDIGVCLENHLWEIGRLLGIARAYHNSDQHFGKWCQSQIICDQNRATLYNYRVMHEVFGSRQAEIKDIPKTSLYKLALPKYKNIRDAVVAEVTQEDRITGEIVDTAIQKYSTPPPTAESTFESEPESTFIPSEAPPVDEEATPTQSEPVESVEGDYEEEVLLVTNLKPEFAPVELQQILELAHAVLQKGPGGSDADFSVCQCIEMRLTDDAF